MVPNLGFHPERKRWGEAHLSKTNIWPVILDNLKTLSRTQDSSIYQQKVVYELSIGTEVGGLK